MRGVRRARARRAGTVPVKRHRYRTQISTTDRTHARTGLRYRTVTVQYRYGTALYRSAKRHRGEPGHTRDTRAPVYRSYTADGVQKWQALSGAQFSSVSVQPCTFSARKRGGRRLLSRSSIRALFCLDRCRRVGKHRARLLKNIGAYRRPGRRGFLAARINVRRRGGGACRRGGGA